MNEQMEIAKMQNAVRIGSIWEAGERAVAASGYKQHSLLNDSSIQVNSASTHINLHMYFM